MLSSKDLEDSVCMLVDSICAQAHDIPMTSRYDLLSYVCSRMFYIMCR